MGAFCRMQTTPDKMNFRSKTCAQKIALISLEVCKISLYMEPCSVYYIILFSYSYLWDAWYNASLLITQTTCKTLLPMTTHDSELCVVSRQNLCFIVFSGLYIASFPITIVHSSVYIIVKRYRQCSWMPLNISIKFQSTLTSFGQWFALTFELGV